MKKIALNFVFCVAMLFSGVVEGEESGLEDRKSLFKTGLSCEEIGRYWPNRHYDFKSDVVYTAQLEVQENIVSRLDRGYIQNSKLAKTLYEGNANLVKTMSEGNAKLTGELAEENANLKSLELRLNIVIGIMAALALVMMSFLLYIALLLKRFETSIRGNLKVLDGNIHAIYGKVSRG